MSTAPSVQINIRVPKDVASDLDTLAEQEHLSRAELVRQILLDGLTQRKRMLALRLYREGRVSASRAAEIAGISLWEMMELIDQADAPNPYTLKEAVEDVRRAVTHAAASFRLK